MKHFQSEQTSLWVWRSDCQAGCWTKSDMSVFKFVFFNYWDSAPESTGLTAILSPLTFQRPQSKLFFSALEWDPIGCNGSSSQVPECRRLVKALLCRGRELWRRRGKRRLYTADGCALVANLSSASCLTNAAANTTCNQAIRGVGGAKSAATLGCWFDLAAEILYQRSGFPISWTTSWTVYPQDLFCWLLGGQLSASWQRPPVVLPTESDTSRLCALWLNLHRYKGRQRRLPFP